MLSHGSEMARLETSVLPVDPSKLSLGELDATRTNRSLEDWNLTLEKDVLDAKHLQRAADELRFSNVPVAFPTETVYGLGADATRSLAVQGIFRAKQRPADNPLIVHVHSLRQLRSLLRPPSSNDNSTSDQRDLRNHVNGSCGEQYDTEPNQTEDDGIPEIYKPLIERFWPGPLTLILPKPKQSVLAPEVTAGLDTFGARMPSNALALALIKLADVPVAAPSANASSKPSPTAAEHVKYDLEGRITTILDGGPCAVGVESTVVDGLSDPPCILRPGGISLEQLRSCPGWAAVTKAYKESSESGATPRAPGMKYRHYSPRAPVMLYEFNSGKPSLKEIYSRLSRSQRIGIIRTKTWPICCGLDSPAAAGQPTQVLAMQTPQHKPHLSEDNSRVTTRTPICVERFRVELGGASGSFDLYEIPLGNRVEQIAQGLFAALRRLDQEDVDAILVEGIDDSEGDAAAAIMNRLRKASEIKQPT